MVGVAVYDGCKLDLAYGTCSNAAEQLGHVADLIDRTVGTGVVVPGWRATVSFDGG